MANIDLWLVVLAGVCALAMLLQWIALWRTSRAFGALSQRVDQQSRKLERNVQDLSERVREVVDNLKPLGEISENVSNNIDEIAGMVRARSQDFEAFADEILRVGREQATKIDYLVTDTVKKFEDTTEVIQRDILRPTMEISAFVKGLRSGIGYLFSKKKPAPGQAGPEEELFI